MIRLATQADVARIAEIYDHIHTAEEDGVASVGWARGVYPTQQTAAEGVRLGDMYVEECDGRIVAAGRINRQQGEAYRQGQWRYPAEAEQVMVLHTLVVDPCIKGQGFGAAFVQYYEAHARAQGCSCLRIDTQEKNTAARAFYGKQGFREAGIVLCTFNGIPNVRLVCLEKPIIQA